MEYDNTERILIDILKELKLMFKISECNKESIGYLNSYNIVKTKLQEYNKNIKVKEIYEETKN